MSVYLRSLKSLAPSNIQLAIGSTCPSGAPGRTPLHNPGPHPAPGFVTRQRRNHSLAQGTALGKSSQKIYSRPEGAKLPEGGSETSGRVNPVRALPVHNFNITELVTP